jgi:large subunit ribosomal protein L25
MANVVAIEAEVRARSGKGAARATRRAGKVPAVIYGGKQEPNLIALDPRVVLRELNKAGWQSRLYEINAGAEPVRALIRGVQFHPVSDAPEHVDFQRLIAGQRIKVAVPVHFENDGISPGIKRGAVLNVVRHAVEVYCDADNIPEQFTADLGSLDFNDNVRWHDLKGTENVKAVIDRDFVVATVVPPKRVPSPAPPPLPHRPRVVPGHQARRLPRRASRAGLAKRPRQRPGLHTGCRWPTYAGSTR